MGQKRHNTLDIRANHHLHYSSTTIPELTCHYPILMLLKMGQSIQSEMIMSTMYNVYPPSPISNIVPSSR